MKTIFFFRAHCVYTASLVLLLLSLNAVVAKAQINGTMSVCVGATTTLTDATTGGTWSTSNPVVATIGSSSGVVTGGTAGTTRITYTVSGSPVTTVVTVNANPLPVQGVTSECIGITNLLTDGSSGGAWSSTNTSVGSIDASGNMTGVSAGTTTISYVLPTGCYTTYPNTVYSNPTSILGTKTVCAGATTQLSDATSGALSYTSSAATIASVDNSGTVTGVAAGTATITYTILHNCYATTVVTVNALPSAISGNAPVCAGLTITLTDPDGSGTWTSATTSKAAIGSASGIVTAVSSGTTTISYFASGGDGCASTTVVTVNSVAAISGSLSVCNGSSTSLSDITSGGTWSSSNTAVGTVGTNGTVTSIGVGTTSITYTSAPGCITAVTVSVTTMPTAILGTASMCAGNTTSLSDATSGGTWASNTPLVATIGTNGLVSGSSTHPGTATITYAIGSCYVTQVATVNANPLPVQGVTSECIGITNLLTDGSSGGAWSSTTPSVGSIDASGNMTGVSAGTTTISYVLPTGCYTTYPNTVYSNPSAILGTMTVCAGAATQLSDATSGALTYTSSTSSVATVDNSGDVTGVAAGTTTITYTILHNCYTTTVVTVNPLPSPIAGNTPVCVGLTITLTDPDGSGTWTSSNTSVATIGSASGVLTGVTVGTATITYIAGSGDGCLGTAVVTANAAPAINGSTAVCNGFTITLSDATSGGTWSSSNTAVGTIGTSGIFAGLSVGTTMITYTIPAGCINTLIVTVNTQPTAILGTASMCNGGSTSLSDATSGGTWASNTPLIASVGTNGTVSSASPYSGTSTISYTIGSCYVTQVATVNPNPLPVQGVTSECVGITTLLTDGTSGGAWSSTTLSVGSIDGSGNFTAISVGTTTVSYILSTGCYTTYPNTVLPNPSAILGTTSICIGASTVLSDATSGALSFTSSNASVATIDNGGTMNGISAGTATITYKVLSGCIATTVVTIDALPSGITGNSPVCVGFTVALTDAAGAGTWASSNTSIATIGSATGVATGVAAGTATVTYTETGGTSGCNQATAVVTVVVAAAISGPSSVCTGSTITLSDASGSGTWSSSATSVGTIGSTSGVVTGIAAGTTSITYTSALGCVNSTTITVNATPAAISGAATLCSASSTITLTDATSSGTWSSSNTAIVTVGSATGVVTSDPSDLGTATITYTVGSCYTTHALTVNPNPLPVQGVTSECVGITSLLTDGTSGGAWTSSTPAAGSIDGSGNITGVAAGTTTITYTIGTGCYVTYPNTVYPNPSAILGTAVVCVGATTSLSDATSGALSFTSSTVSVATVDNGGTVTGVLAGTTTITYTILPGSCIATTVVTVNTLPSGITGNSPVCVGFTVTLTDAAGAGTWGSSNSSIATIGSSSGVATGVASGTATITYTETAGGSGCNQATAIVTINVAAAISGPSSVCTGATITLSDVSGSGTWSSSATSVGTIGSTSGVVAGIATGTTSITYTSAAGCVNTTTITVNPTPATISGASTLCSASSTITLTDVTSSGTWSSSNTAIVTVGSATGVVTSDPSTTGTATITYTAGGCYATHPLTVNPNPLPIQGANGECQGITILLTDATAGGAWTSSTPASGSVDGSGNVTGVAVGTTTITYTIGTGCYITYPNTIRANPSAILGTTTACVGGTTNLSDATSGALSFTSSTVSVATVNNAGNVTGVSAGTTTITYTITSGCYATTTVTVIALPTAILGNTPLCPGTTITLTDASGSGTWTSSTTSVATIGSSSGIVSAVTDGTTRVVYTETGISVCNQVSVIVTVSPVAAISGSSAACLGSTITLSDATTGGTWSSSNTAVGTIGTDGTFTAISVGTTSVTYTTAPGCTTAKTITVNTAPTSINGTFVMCGGGTTTLTDATSGGSWSSGGPLVATVVGSTGVVSGSAIYSGTATITYGIGSCKITQVITVNPNPLPVQGVTYECVGITNLLTDATAGGTWSSSTPANGSIDASGNMTGVAAGTTTITYTLATGCFVTYPNTVRANPAAISGTTTVCVGATTQLSDATSGALSYTSSTASVATVINSGTVTGVSAGTTTITYKITTGCYSTTVVTVIALPAAITGNSPTCAGTTVSLTDAAGAGTWVSNHTSVATVGSTGVVTGVVGGTATISYTASTGCTVTTIVTINPILAITGTTSTCVGSTTTLADATSGGTWASGATGVATIGSSSGVVTGVSAGTSAITYTLATGCTATTTVTIGSLTAITGTATVCTRYTTNLTDATAGGTWHSSYGLVATVDGTGLVTASTYLAGTATISYSLGSCVATQVVTVSATPLPVQGSSWECQGITITLTDGTAGGAWSSSNANVSIDGSGNATGSSVGTATVSYTMPTGCFTTYPNTVRANPAAITGTFTVCAGATTTLSDVTANPISYTSSDVTVATVINDGEVTGVANGTATITYKILSTCIATQVVTVDAPAVASILGPSTISQSGGDVTFSDATSGGVWVSSNASVIALTGSTANPITADALTSSGSATISYSFTDGAGCTTTVTKSVSAAARFAHFDSTTNGTITLYAGSAANITDITGGGAWMSSDVGVANVDGNGMVTGMMPGNVNIFHMSESGNATSITPVVVIPFPVDVSVIPNPNKGTFTIKGVLGTAHDEDATLEIIDMLGQVIFKNNVTATGGRINETVSLGNSIPNGMYILNVQSGASKNVFHFVIEQ